MHKSFFILVTLFFAVNIIAQDEDNCYEFPDNKKIKKLYDQSFDKKKYPTYAERFKLLKETLDEEPNCVPCLYEMAGRTYSRARAQGLSFKNAKKYYKQIVDICPNFKANVYYRLGTINYFEKNDQEAVKYFKKFQEFDSDYPNAFSKSHDKLLSSVEKVMKELSFYDEFYKNKVPFDPKTVTNVSSTKHEFLPMISPDNELLFFTRQFNQKFKGDIVSKLVEELTLSKRDDINSDFDNGTPLPKPFNQGYKYGGVSLSVDNKEMYVCACFPLKDKNYNNCDIYVTKYQYIKDDKGKYHYEWSELKNLGNNVNTETTWEAQPTISADGKTLFFATARPNTRGIDIFYTERQEDGSWGKAKNVGPPINSELNDKSPFLHTDSKTLYFASEVSDNRKGAGGFDLFYSKQKKDGTWSTPKNIGYPINSSGDEEGIIVSTDGKLAYFSSDRMKNTVGGKDIFSFELYKEARPEKVVIVKGSLNDNDGNIANNAKLKIDYLNSDSTQEVDIQTDDGNYALAIQLDSNEDVMLSVDNENTAYSSRLIKNDSEVVLKNSDLKVAEIQEGEKYNINDIYFATDSYELNKEAKIILNSFAKYLQKNKNLKLEIQGHTDDIGDNQKNLSLSESRAQEVKSFLISKGIPANRLKAKGYGESRPKFPNTNNNYRAKNRRTEFMVIEK